MHIRSKRVIRGAVSNASVLKIGFPSLLPQSFLDPPVDLAQEDRLVEDARHHPLRLGRCDAFRTLRMLLANLPSQGPVEDEQVEEEVHDPERVQHQPHRNSLVDPQHGESTAPT